MGIDLKARLEVAFADTVSFISATQDVSGKLTPDVGSPQVVKAKMKRKNELVVVNIAGDTVMSQVQAILLGTFGVTVEGHLYTLPVRFSPRVEVRCLSVGEFTDENGALYDKVMFP